MYPDMEYISLALGEKIIELLDECGATEAEKSAALDLVRAIVPVSSNSTIAKTQAEEEERIT
jgi:hypothetical protein